MSTAVSMETSTVKDKYPVCVKKNDEIAESSLVRADWRYTKCIFYFFRADSHAKYIFVINGKDVNFGDDE